MYDFLKMKLPLDTVIATSQIKPTKNTLTKVIFSITVVKEFSEK